MCNMPRIIVFAGMFDPGVLARVSRFLLGEVEVVWSVGSLPDVPRPITHGKRGSGHQERVHQCMYQWKLKDR
jgi:hypothetical protein